MSDDAILEAGLDHLGLVGTARDALVVDVATKLRGWRATPALDLFRCIPLGCTLTRSSCAKRHAQSRPDVTAPGKHRPTAGDCRTCPVGEAHRKGQRPEVWPSGAPITAGEPLSTPLPAEPSPSLRAGRSVLIEMRARTAANVKHSKPPKKEPRMDPDRRNGAERRITHNGRTDNLSGWAKSLGLTSVAISHRLSRGWTEEEAVTVAKGYSPERLKRTGRPASTEKPFRIADVKWPATETDATAVTEIGEAVGGQRGPESKSALDWLVMLGFRVEDAGRSPNGKLVLLVDADLVPADAA